MLSVFHLFLWPNNTPLHTYIHNLMFIGDIWVVPTFWLLMSNATINICRFVCGCTFSFLLGRHLVMKFLGHMVSLCYPKQLHKYLVRMFRFHQDVFNMLMITF